jgi:hypothetical protein
MPLGEGPEFSHEVFIALIVSEKAEARELKPFVWVLEAMSGIPARGRVVQQGLFVSHQ